MIAVVVELVLLYWRVDAGCCAVRQSLDDPELLAFAVV